MNLDVVVEVSPEHDEFLQCYAHDVPLIDLHQMLAPSPSFHNLGRDRDGFGPLLDVLDALDSSELPEASLSVLRYCFEVAFREGGDATTDASIARFQRKVEHLRKLGAFAWTTGRVKGTRAIPRAMIPQARYLWYLRNVQSAKSVHELGVYPNFGGTRDFAALYFLNSFGI